MDIKKMSLEELEKLSHLDIAYNILKFDKKQLTTVSLLKEVCQALKYSDNEFENLIGDFYTSLNLDKRFIFIDNKWDLSENHQVKIVVDDELDEEEIDEEEESEDEEVIEDEAVVDDVNTLDDVDDELDNDLDDLSIVDDTELEEDNDL